MAGDDNDNNNNDDGNYDDDQYDDDDQYQGNQNNNKAGGDDFFTVTYDPTYDDDEGFEWYVPQSIDPGKGLFYFTFSCVTLLLLFVLPLLVILTKRRRKKKKKKMAAKKLAEEQMAAQQALVETNNNNNHLDENQLKELGKIDDDVSEVSMNYKPMEEDNSPPEIQTDMRKVKATFRSIIRYDKESKRIIRYTIPFTMYAILGSLLDAVALALISHFVGTKEVTAYVIVDALISITDEFLAGPLYATTTLCAHAVGASNYYQAGQYIQLAVLIYVVLAIPVFIFWYVYMYDIILWLQWGDERVAALAQMYIRIVIWADIVDSITGACSHLLDVTGHEIFTTICGIGENLAFVILLSILILAGVDFSLDVVAYLEIVGTFALNVTLVGVAYGMGWIQPFHRGIFSGNSITNWSAISAMLKTAIPLSFGCVVTNAEWTILTIFVSHLGAAEVAAWNILGSVWEVFEDLISGVGDAAEIRVSYHLGNNHPSLAKLSAYKSIAIGMLGASVVSLMFMIVQDKIPAFFTPDKTLQELIRVTLPYVSFGNLALHFGYLCWYLVGAQGRYKLGTWINFLASWGLTMPLAALFTYKYNWDLQGITAAVVIGYVGVGACLSYILFTSDWQARALKISQQNQEMIDGNYMKDFDERDDTEEREEEVYAALNSGRSRAAKASAQRGIRLIVAPPGPLRIQIIGRIVMEVFPSSPFYGRLFPGDVVLSVDGVDVTNAPESAVFDLLSKSKQEHRQLTILTTPNQMYDNEASPGASGDIPDFDDHEEEDALMNHSRIRDHDDDGDDDDVLILHERLRNMTFT